MLFKNINIIDQDFKVKKDMYVVINEDIITYVGEKYPDTQFTDFGEIYDGKNKLMIPGFVNTHAHTPMTLLRGYSENKTLQDWLFNNIFPFEAQMTEEDVYNGMLLGIAEMLMFGIVSTTDMYFKCERMCQAALETKTKFNICNGMTCFDDSDYKNNKAFKETENMLKYYHKANNGAILADASIHAEYTSKPKQVGQVVEYAKKNDLNIHLHLSETGLEHEECIKRYGKTPAEYFYDLGAFDRRTTAAHCVWISENDMDIFKKNGVTIASNPVSNLKLASGICPLPRAMEKGINISIGTDGMASNNNMNILEEIKLITILHKGVNYDPTLITSEEVLKMATLNGYISQGRMDSGLIKEGYKADLAVIDIDKPYYYPEHNALNNLIYSSVGSDVCMTITDGKILYKDGEYLTLDIEKVKCNAFKSKRSILERL